MKTGNILEDEERNYIQNNYPAMDCVEIAEFLEREPKVIQQYVRRLYNGSGKPVEQRVQETKLVDEKKKHEKKVQKLEEKVVEDIDKQNKFLKRFDPEDDHPLKSTAVWGEILQQFDAGEIRQFIEEYDGYIDQFEGEILHSEKIQVLDAIRLGILGNRSLRQEKLILDEIRGLEKRLAKQRISKADQADIDLTEHNLSLARQIQSKASDSFRALNESKLKSMEKLKATREKRDDARNSAFKTSFKDWIKRLVDDRNLREELGQYMELHRIAADKEYERLTTPHEYADGVVDIPILNEFTVGKLEVEES